jgi:hypothetical protein
VCNYLRLVDFSFDVEDDVEPDDFDSPLVEFIVLPFGEEVPELIVGELCTGALLILYCDEDELLEIVLFPED